MKSLKFTCLIIIVLSVPSGTQAQSSGGVFSITHTVTANGGGTSSGTPFEVKGTIAQPLASDEIVTAPYTLRSGFWNPIIAPTAANASLGGRVLTADGTPIKDAILYLTGGTLTVPRISRTNGFGYFSFENVEVGHLYILAISTKRYGFAQNSQTFMLNDNLTDIVFQASWKN